MLVTRCEMCDNLTTGKKLCAKCFMLHEVPFRHCVICGTEIKKQNDKRLLTFNEYTNKKTCSYKCTVIARSAKPDDLSVLGYRLKAYEKKSFTDKTEALAFVDELQKNGYHTVNKIKKPKFTRNTGFYGVCPNRSVTHDGEFFLIFLTTSERVYNSY